MTNWRVDFAAISFFSSTHTQHCNAVSSVQGHRCLKKCHPKCSLQISNKVATWSWQWYNLPNVQNPVFNVTVDDHTESRLLWPICLQYCNCYDVNNFPDSSLKKRQHNREQKSGGIDLVVQLTNLVSTCFLMKSHLSAQRTNITIKYSTVLLVTIVGYKKI